MNKSIRHMEFVKCHLDAIWARYSHIEMGYNLLFNVDSKKIASRSLLTWVCDKEITLHEPETWSDMMVKVYILVSCKIGWLHPNRWSQWCGSELSQIGILCHFQGCRAFSILMLSSSPYTTYPIMGIPLHALSVEMWATMLYLLLCTMGVPKE